VNKVAKGFLRALAALAILFVLAALLVNLYVESEGVRSRLESAVSKAIRMPVALTGVRFSFWSGLTVNGATIPGAPGGEEPFLLAPKVSARLEWRPLFSRRLVIREVLIDSPKVVWTQTEKGKWRLPHTEAEEEKREKGREKRPKKEIGGDEAISAVPSPSVGGAPSTGLAALPEEESLSEGKRHAPPEQAGAGEKAQEDGLEFRIVLARMQNATLHFLDRKGEPVAVFEGVTVDLPFAGKNEARGDVNIRKLTLHNTVVVEEITTPFVYEQGQLTLPQVNARIAGGALCGNYTLQPDEEGSPFSLGVEFSDVDLNRLISEVGADDALQKAEGKLHGRLDLAGASSEKKTFQGKGWAELKAGRMEQYPFLQVLGQTLQIDELTRLELQQANLEVHVARSRVYVDRLTLDSTNLNLTAKGTVRFDGRLDLDAGLAVNEKIARRIPNWVYAGFREEPGGGNRRLPFSITGTLSNPETDLVKALMGEKLERQATDLFRAFRNIATGDKKKKDDRKGKPGSGETDH